jgi:hypothetical protein
VFVARCFPLVLHSFSVIAFEGHGWIQPYKKLPPDRVGKRGMEQPLLSFWFLRFWKPLHILQSSNHFHNQHDYKGKFLLGTVGSTLILSDIFCIFFAPSSLVQNHPVPYIKTIITSWKKQDKPTI